ncbi:hypothetical protein ANANG_G00002980 [Anguilla anguilla]|uniref:ornithine decarboxylase n=1 Tax=Anguilla anguilla TaxID=7936 RepID=A0A9D3MW94_ANGAN|nr:hypothetical protein ANANG_G00002980 [Anguilla anguilla]
MPTLLPTSGKSPSDVSMPTDPAPTPARLPQGQRCLATEQFDALYQAARIVQKGGRRARRKGTGSWPRQAKPRVRPSGLPYAAWLGERVGVGEAAEEADGEGELLLPVTLSNLPPQAQRKGQFGTAQVQDDRLRHCWSQVRVLEGVKRGEGPLEANYFSVQQGLLYYHTTRRGEVRELLVLPHQLVLRIATDDSKALCRMSAKFGATLESSRLLLECAWELGLDIIGVSFHVGSGCTDPETYSQAISDARCVFDMGAELGYNMTLLDIGGGFPGSDDSKLKFEEFTAVVNPALDKYFPADSVVQVIAEPGRYYVTSAYTLAVNIIAKKVVIREQSACNGKIWENATGATCSISKADGANNRTLMYYVNEGVYGSFVDVIFSYAHFLATPHKKLKPGERTYPCSIWGQTCDGLDRIVEQCILPDLQVGEWLLFHNMGAYTIPMYCTFNGFQKPDIHYVMSRSVWQRIQQISTQGLHGPIEEVCPSDLPSCCRRESSLELPAKPFPARMRCSLP